MNEENSRFKELNAINRKLIADSIMLAIQNGHCSPELIAQNIQVVSPDGAGITTMAMDRISKEVMVLLSNWEILAPLTDQQQDGYIKCIVHCWGHFAPDIQQLLIEHGHTEKEIRGIFQELPNDKKEIISRVLNGEAKWNDIAESFPKANHCVALRIVNPTVVTQENQTQKILMEDLRVGYWDDETQKWIIEGPYPFIDYSPLTVRENLNKGTVVSHWREVTDEELNDWHHRYDPMNTYGYLNVIVDPDHAKDVYRALLVAHNMLNNFVKQEPNKEVAKTINGFAEILSDMAGCFDREADIHNEAVDAYKKYEDLKDAIYHDPKHHNDIIDYVVSKKIINSQKSREPSEESDSVE